jgi:prepilin-type N-terminal cleavage/methylation domain-containing protein
LWRDKQGFTLIEVLATVAIVGLLLSAMYSFVIMSNKMYRSGSDKNDLHYDLRIASERITREVRFAKSLELLDSWNPADAEPGYRYIYFDEVNNVVVFVNGEGEQLFSGNFISGLVFKLDGNTLNFKLEAAKRTFTYKLESSVLLLNLKEQDLISLDHPVTAVRFTTP